MATAAYNSASQAFIQRDITPTIKKQYSGQLPAINLHTLATSSKGNKCHSTVFAKIAANFSSSQGFVVSKYDRSPIQAMATSAEGSVSTVNVPLDSEIGVSYELLRDKLAAGEWEEADNETRRLLCVLAGPEAAKRKWVYFSEVQFIPSKDLLTIDSLWRAYSNDRFGFSVQRKLWIQSKKAWKPFFLKIDWTYGENSTYKKFPMEFTWDIDAAVGHLPLTNALRGTQLFYKLLTHPAFDKFDRETEMPTLEANDIPTFTGESDINIPGVFTSSPPAETSSNKVESSVLDGIFDSSEYGF